VSGADRACRPPWSAVILSLISVVKSLSYSHTLAGVVEEEKFLLPNTIAFWFSHALEGPPSTPFGVPDPEFQIGNGPDDTEYPAVMRPCARRLRGGS
jgi:hypothetical protein